MARELYVCRRCCSRDFFALFVVNALLVVVAALMVHFQQSLVHSKWIVIVRGAFDRSADTFASGMLVLGAVLLALVVFGLVVTLLRLKKLLIVYGMALTLTLIAMAFLVVSAFQVSGEAAQWRDNKQYSGSVVESNNSNSSTKEAQVEAHFNAVYCDAQRAFFCDHATLNELLAFGLNNLAGSNSNLTSAAGICAQSQGSNASSSSSSAGWGQLCTYCAGTKSYEEFQAVVAWSKDNCDFSASTAAWCSATPLNDANSTNSSVVGMAAAVSSPYSSCRATLLQETVTWSRGLGIMWSVTCLLLLLLLISVALLLQTHEHADAIDLDDVETPSESGVYEKA